MKIALITNSSLRHIYWVSELYSQNSVSVILHIKNNNSFSLKKIKSKKPLLFGYFNFFLKLCSIIYNYFSYNSLRKRIIRAENDLLPKALKKL